MRVKILGRKGLWLITRRWDISYWPPRAWVPFTIRQGISGRRGWWGALRVTRLQANQR